MGSSAQWSDLREHPTLDELREWVYLHLGRAIIVTVLVPPIASTTLFHDLARDLARTDWLRVVLEEGSGYPTPDTLRSLLSKVHIAEVDVVLVGTERSSEEKVSHDSAQHWESLVLREADQIGLSTRAFVALAGPATTRVSARATGYEDGFTLPANREQLLRSLALEAAGRDELRRKGSSPPCYL